MASAGENRLLSASKSSDSRLAVQLHPLVILTISDYVTRHILREQPGPIVGAILGAQNGREITMEHAFECKLETLEDGSYIMHPAWFAERLQQYKDVHKEPPLDLVGWFVLGSSAGPEPHHVPIHTQLLEQYNESPLFLVFHPSSIADSSPTGAKLPLTVYESIFEVGGDVQKGAKQDGGDAASLDLRFHELSYTVDTGEAEMIGVDFVAKGGARATDDKRMSHRAATTTGKGKKRVADSDEDKSNTADRETGDDGDILSAADEERIATLASKANAIRMLKQRISLLRKYLEAVPHCYLNDATCTGRGEHTQISHTILRSIASLLARLPLVAPTTPSTGSASHEDTIYRQEAAAEATDVALVSLLGSLASLLQDAQSLGQKGGIVETQISRSKVVAGNTALGRLQLPADQGVHMDDEDGDAVMSEAKA